MAGKLIVNGFKQAVLGGTLTVLIDHEPVQSVKVGERTEITIQNESVSLSVQCGRNKSKNSVLIHGDMITEVDCKYNRFSGAITLEIVSKNPISSDESPNISNTPTLPYTIGTAGDMLEVYDTYAILKHKGVLNVMAQGFKGEKRINFSSITAIELRKGSLANGYIQFSVGGSDSKRSLFGAGGDENTIMFHPSDNGLAQEIVDYIESQREKLARPTVIQQSTSSDADELLKYKNLLDMGVITQEEFDAKKKQLLGL